MLPSLYARWVGEFLGELPPDETLATCSSCAMCPPATDQRMGVRYFKPNTKCCTYMPDLPNYLAGAALIDDDPAMARGRASLTARIAARSGVVPLGVFAPPQARERYQQTAKAGFGRDAALLCPHYIADGGLCGIWRYRNSVCATYFCKHNRGGIGATFWHLLRDLLLDVERDLATWCLAELGFGPEGAGLQLPRDSSGLPREANEDGDAINGAVKASRDSASPVPASNGSSSGGPAFEGHASKGHAPGDRVKMWGAWAGKEAELFAECARLVAPLSWPEVIAACGPAVRLIARSVHESYARMLSTDIPGALRAEPYRVIGSGAGKVQLRGYSSSDTVEIPVKLLEVLHYFDGRPTREALAAIQAEQKLHIQDGLLRRLVDYGFLGAD
jgi:hypothetical protein